MGRQSISTGSAQADDPVPDEGPDVEVEQRTCDVPLDLHGWRVDRALTQLVPEFSRSYLQQLLADGAVTLRGQPCRKASQRVAVGDALAVLLRPTPQAQAFVAQPMALDVVFEDAHLLVIHKPAGLVVHPAAGHWSGTLLNGLLAHHAGAAALPRAGIVQRLDKDTSGLMLVGKSRAAVDALVRAIGAREVNRQYLALAHKAWGPRKHREVDAPIGRHKTQRVRMAVAPNGKPAITHYEPMEHLGQITVLRCRLETGRTHQIRVHLQSIGHPIVGDPVYGGSRKTPVFPRQALHAEILEFTHPISGEWLEFEAPLPADMAALVEALRAAP